MKQNETQSELQKRIAAELQEKAKKKAFESERPDGVEDSAYVKDLTGPSDFKWLWIVLVAAIFGVGIWIIISAL